MTYVLNKLSFLHIESIIDVKSYRFLYQNVHKEKHYELLMNEWSNFQVVARASIYLTIISFVTSANFSL